MLTIENDRPDWSTIAPFPLKIAHEAPIFIFLFILNFPWSAIEVL